MAGLLENFVGEKAVSIVKVNGEKELALDEEALASILNQEKVRGKPIMIISLSGAFRKGKSFMLTILLRYLRENGQVNSNWLGFKNLMDGFYWKGGKEAVTMGIVMWKEAFFLKDTSGKEVAVFLMDTQGLFDRKLNKTQCTAIFALSTLLSSVQVFNISQQIQGDHLEYLEFFTSYAESLKGSSHVKTAPFQKLVFLVRDWSNPGDHEYGLSSRSANEGYLSEVLQDNVGKNAESDIGKCIQKSFLEIECYLLPYPGQKVAVTTKTNPFNGELKDIDPQFKEYAKNFAAELLKPGNIVKKTIDGREVTGIDFLNYAVSSARQFKSGALPEIQSMREVTATTLCIKVVEEFTEVYVQEMARETTKFVPERQLLQNHENKVKDMRRKFIKRVSFGSSAVVTKYSAELERVLYQKYEIVKKSNDVRKGKLVASMAVAVQRYEESYTEEMSRKYWEGYTETDKFYEFHGKILKEKREEFVKKFCNCPENEIYGEKLTQDLKKAYSWHQKRNEEQKASPIAPYIEGYVKHFLSAVQKNLKKYLDDNLLTEKCEAALNDTLEFLVTKDWHLSSRKVEVEKVLRTIIPQLQRINATKRESVRLIFENAIQELQATYMTVMDQGMKSVYVKPEVLREAHDKMKKMLKKKLKKNEVIKENYEGSELWEEFIDKLYDNLDQELERRSGINVGNKEVYPHTVSKVEDFFATALAVIITIIGLPIAIAVGIPALVGYGVYRGVAALRKLVIRSFEK